MSKPEFTEVESPTATAAALHFRGHGWSLTVPVALIAAALGAFGFSAARPAATSELTAKDCREAREAVTQLQADARSRDEHARKFEQDVTTTLSLLLVRTDKLR